MSSPPADDEVVAVAERILTMFGDSERRARVAYRNRRVAFDWHMVKAIAMLSLASFLFQLGLVLSNIPLANTIRNTVCDNGFGAGTSNAQPALCMSPDVQYHARTVNIINLVRGLASVIPGEFGRPLRTTCCHNQIVAGVLVQTLINLGVIVAKQSVPDILTSIVLTFGGGVGIVEATVFSIMYDVWKREWRGIAFQLASCSILLPRPLGSMIARLMMQSGGLQSPLWTGSHLIALAMCLVFLLPKMRFPPQFAHPMEPPSGIPRDAYAATEAPRSMRHQLKNSWRISCNYLKFTKGMVEIVLVGVLVRPMVPASMGILGQYIQVRYGKDDTVLSKLDFLQAVEISSGFMLVMPLYFLSWPTQNPLKRDLFLAKVLIGLIPVGMMLTGVASSFGVATAGVALTAAGLPVVGLIRASMANMVLREHICALFCLMAVIEQLAIVFFNFVLNALFQVGLSNMHEDQNWLGLPFFFVGGWFFMLCRGFLSAHPRKLDYFAGLGHTWDGRDIVLRNIDGRPTYIIEGINSETLRGTRGGLANPE
ncbi:hypothetical protein PFICI_06309 [Pestalotiopsis fici W106-1]|uniref:Major facilitator superfamily (MFS) profile domain-containing protein n=1 Tax=Pestalotiopsis fici (strain W106-1 / CGMCC3.15140) TaxID=1229662 RepID=W3X7F0_PESFW|nr:uncharacterized protein PFICI_06309 [Pestalotiopsis fici W106-1]ETS81307.1 hypothetical protein PFICI_06309 [Pestalotiopsis fici W106-1]